MARQSPGFNPALETMITKIISGGQTGADRGGLDVAIRHGIPHGGWCPKGRKAEDGVIPDKYLKSSFAQDDFDRVNLTDRDIGFSRRTRFEVFQDDDAVILDSQ